MIAVGSESKSLAKNSVILFSIMMVGNLINYGYQIAMGNLLSAEDYGTWNALLALYTITSVPSGVFLMVSSRYFSRYKALGDDERASRFIKRLLKASLICAVIIVCAGMTLAWPISWLLKIDDPMYVVATMFAVALCCAFPVFSGALQGLSRFNAYGISSVIAAAAKLGFSVLFVVCGWGLFGAAGGLAASTVCAILFCLYELRNVVDWKSESNAILGRDEILKCIGGAFWIQLILATITNGDTMLIKALFTAQDAGIYSSGMVIAKISVYITGAVTVVLFPMAAASQIKKESTLPILAKSIIFGGGLAAICATLLSLFAEPLISLLFGVKYLDAVPTLPYICALAVVIALITILTNYLVAIGKESFFIGSAGLGCVLIVAGVSFFHERMVDVILTMTVILAVVFIVNIIQIIRLQLSMKIQMPRKEDSDEEEPVDNNACI